VFREWGLGGPGIGATATLEKSEVNLGEFFDSPRFLLVHDIDHPPHVVYLISVSDLDVRVSYFQGVGFGFLIWVSGFGHRVSVLGFGFRVLGFRFRVSGFGFRVSGGRYDPAHAVHLETMVAG
jgi:hypothetical protein